MNGVAKIVGERGELGYNYGMQKAIIMTSCWFSKLPADHLKFGISRGTPRGMAAGYRKYMKLAPGPWFSSVTPQEYQRLYQAEVLDKLDPERVVKELLDFADGQVPTLVCYELPHKPDWCHRGLVSLWFKQTIDLDVFEFGMEDCGCGGKHPKLHPFQMPRIEPPVPDRHEEIRPYIGKIFRTDGGKRAWQVRGQHPEHVDQVLITDGKREMTITVETMLEKLRQSA